MSNLKLAKRFNKRIKKRIEKEKSKRKLAVINTAEEIFEEIKKDTPKDTGYLASRNKLEILKDKIIFSNDAHYSDDVEYDHVSFFRINLFLENFTDKIKKKLKK